MQPLSAKRFVHQFTQTNLAPPEKVFPLLCPVREAEWVPGWKYRLIYSRSGVAEAGCVFGTPNPDGSETIWQVTHYEPNTAIRFAWVRPDMIATQIEIKLQPTGDGKTIVYLQYAYTGLSSAGNAEITGYSEVWFRDKMLGWENAINQYLQTGRLVNTVTPE